MTFDRACEIVAEINRAALLAMGFDTDKPLGQWLSDVSLADMIEADRQVREHNDLPPDENGSRTIFIHPDPRLISAVYTLVNFPADGRDIIVYDGRGKCVVVAPIKVSEEEDDEE